MPKRDLKEQLQTILDMLNEGAVSEEMGIQMTIAMLMDLTDDPKFLEMRERYLAFEERRNQREVEEARSRRPMLMAVDDPAYRPAVD